MKKKENKLYLQKKKRFLAKIIGTEDRPRLSVFRSSKHIYAQIIDDTKGYTLISSNSLIFKEKISDLEQKLTKLKQAYIIGKKLAEKARENNITNVVFDRGNHPYHGRIKELANGSRENGLKF